MKRFVYVAAVEMEAGGVSVTTLRHAFVQAVTHLEALGSGLEVLRLPATSYIVNDTVIELDDGAADRNRVEDRTGKPPLPPGHPDRGGSLG